MACISHLANLILEHLIRGSAVSVPHLVCYLDTCNRHTVLHLLSSRDATPPRQRVWEGEVLWEQAKLPQHAALVPSDMLMIQPITTYVYYGGEGNFDPLVGRWNSR